METSNKIYESTFKTVPSDFRSEEYKEGVRAGIDLIINGEIHQTTYDIGSAQMDAYAFGYERGSNAARRYLEESKEK